MYLAKRQLYIVDNIDSTTPSNVVDAIRLTASRIIEVITIE